VIGLFNFFNRYADALQLNPPPEAPATDTKEQEHGNR
jgi:hypothetical protein